MNLGPNEMLLVAVGTVLHGLVSGLLLKVACDLNAFEPPTHLFRCMSIAIVLALAELPVCYLAYKAGLALGLSETSLAIFGITVGLAVSAVLSTVVFIPTLRLRPLAALKLWLVWLLVRVLIDLLFAMLVAGGWTTVDSIRRLF